MRRLLPRLRGDRRGIATVEFAIIAPVLFILIIGIAQLGVIFYAHAGLRNAVAEGARFATIFPRPTSAQVATRVQDNRPMASAGRYTDPQIVWGIANGAHYADIRMSYSLPLNFLFFETPPITLTYCRRTFVPPAAPPPVTPGLCT